MLASRLSCSLLLCVALWCPATCAKSLFEFTLTDLTDTAPHALAQYQGQTLVVSFFEQGCRWCLRQMQALNGLEQNIAVVAIGVGGHALGLRQWAMRAEPRYPVLMASHAMLRDIGTLPATPITVLVGRDGQIRQTIRGYLPLAQLGGLVQQLNDTERLPSG